MEIVVLYVIVPVVLVVCIVMVPTMLALATRQCPEIRELQLSEEPNWNKLGLDLRIGSEEAYSVVTHEASQDKPFFEQNFREIEERVVRNLDPVPRDRSIGS